MDVDTSFNGSLFTAAEAKLSWFEANVFPQLQNEYRSFHTTLCNLINLLEKKGLIQPDPYKNDKKISSITVPPDGPFLDNERSMVMGARLSEFESMLDYICNIHKFTIANTTMNQIKILLGINNYIQWSSVVPTSQKANTKALAEIANSIKMGSDKLAINMITDCITQSTKTINRINGILKEITDFQKELYKVDIRRKILISPQFQSDKITSAAASSTQIRKLFQTSFFVFFYGLDSSIKAFFRLISRKGRINQLPRHAILVHGSPLVHKHAIYLLQISISLRVM